MGHNLRALWDDPRPTQAPEPRGRDWALVAVLALIIGTAWTWPRTPRQGSDVEASRPLQTTRTS